MPFEHASPAETYHKPLTHTTTNSPVRESVLAGKTTRTK